MQNKKWRVLIVDDEFRIGRLIKKLIHWGEFALEYVDVVDNGGTAFEIIQSVRCPDVVITDIRMPKINGLELIAMTREIHKNMKFVVISGYKEFEYAHQALQYGVELLFGEEYGVNVYSTAGQGTDVEITIPANYKTDREKDYEERIVEN